MIKAIVRHTKSERVHSVQLAMRAHLTDDLPASLPLDTCPWDFDPGSSCRAPATPSDWRRCRSRRPSDLLCSSDGGPLPSPSTDVTDATVPTDAGGSEPIGTSRTSAPPGASGCARGPSRASDTDGADGRARDRAAKGLGGGNRRGSEAAAAAVTALRSLSVWSESGSGADGRHAGALPARRMWAATAKNGTHKDHLLDTDACTLMLPARSSVEC